MATRPSSSALNVIQDAKQLVAKAKQLLPAVEKAERARGKTAGTNLAFVKQLDADIKAYEASATTQSAIATRAKSATEAEVRARAALAAELKSIRDDVADAVPDPAIQRAFGRGARVNMNVTNSLLEAADAVIGSFATHALAVKDAGVKKARVDGLAKMRGALAAADATQRGDITERLGATGGKSALLASIAKGIARLRKRLAQVEGAVAASTKAALLTTTSRRKAVKKRAPKVPAT